jgi:small subunit ribosomal protein S17
MMTVLRERELGIERERRSHEREPGRERKRAQHARRARRTSAKMKDTIVVTEERRGQHALYGKYMRATKYDAHDAGNTASEGDEVEIMQTRPIQDQELAPRPRRPPVARRDLHADVDVAGARVKPARPGESRDPTPHDARRRGQHRRQARPVHPRARVQQPQDVLARRHGRLLVKKAIPTAPSRRARSSRASS